MNKKQLQRYNQAYDFFDNKGLEGYCTLVSIAMMFPDALLKNILENSTDKVRDDNNKLKYKIRTADNIDRFILSISFTMEDLGIFTKVQEIQIIYPNRYEKYRGYGDINNLNNIISQYDKGEYFIVLPDHILTIKDGVPLDKYPKKKMGDLVLKIIHIKYVNE